MPATCVGGGGLHLVVDGPVAGGGGMLLAAAGLVLGEVGFAFAFEVVGVVVLGVLLVELTERVGL